MNNTKFYINTFKLQKSIDAIVLAMENSFKDIQSSLDVLKKLFYEEDDWLATKKYLDNLSLKELEELLFSNDNTFNANFSKQLYNYYINRTLFEISKKKYGATTLPSSSISLTKHSYLSTFRVLLFTRG